MPHYRGAWSAKMSRKQRQVQVLVFDLTHVESSCLHSCRRFCFLYPSCKDQTIIQSSEFSAKPKPSSSDLHHDSLTINLANPLIYTPFGDDFTIDGIEVGYGIGFASLIRLNGWIEPSFCLGTCDPAGLGELAEQHLADVHQCRDEGIGNYGLLSVSRIIWIWTKHDIWTWIPY